MIPAGPGAAVLIVGTIGIVVVFFTLTIKAGMRQNAAKRASATSTTPRSQYSDDSETELSRARDLISSRMTCEYCGEMCMPGMRCSGCGATKPLVS